MLNENFFRLRQNYIFSEVAKKTQAFKATHPDVKLFSYGIGDVCFPLGSCVSKAMSDFADKMATDKGFAGYTAEGGTSDLKDAICAYYKRSCGIDVFYDEVFVSDGAKSDIGGLLELFAEGSSVLMQDPVYPAYSDASVLRGMKVGTVAANRQNGFLPMPPNTRFDVIFICSPNNPTGMSYDFAGLEKWVNYAKKVGAVILFDAAYSAFSPDGYPKSIFQIDGAREVAIEICSFSKGFGFTGVRCGYTVVPNKLQVSGTGLNSLWRRRQAARFNGASVLAQAGAVAALSDEGIRQAEVAVEHYKSNVNVLKNRLLCRGLSVYGNGPYLWVRCPDGFDGEEYFDYLLENKHEIVIPGIGFGEEGKYFVRYGCFFR